MSTDYKLAWAAATDAANKQIRKAGREKWNHKDYSLACDTLMQECKDENVVPARWRRAESLMILPSGSSSRERANGGKWKSTKKLLKHIRNITALEACPI